MSFRATKKPIILEILSSDDDIPKEADEEEDDVQATPVPKRRRNTAKPRSAQKKDRATSRVEAQLDDDADSLLGGPSTPPTNSPSPTPPPTVRPSRQPRHPRDSVKVEVFDDSEDEVLNDLLEDSD